MKIDQVLEKHGAKIAAPNVDFNGKDCSVIIYEQKPSGAWSPIFEIAGFPKRRDWHAARPEILEIASKKLRSGGYVASQSWPPHKNWDSKKAV